MVGETFGRLSVVSEGEKSRSNKTRWICLCSCGKTKTVLDAKLRTGNTKSCGCLRKEKTKSRRLTHGMTKTPLHVVWLGMKQRCSNVNSDSYVYYGARGISVCKEWDDDFLKFYEWSMANGYEKGLQLDRIKNDGDYGPDNCRYVTNKVNQNNKRTNRFIEIGGITKTIAQWSDSSGIEQKVIQSRLRYGWSSNRLIEPKRIVPHREIN